MVIKVSWKRLALILVLVAAVGGAVMGYSMNSLFYNVRDVSIEEVVSDPQSFDDVHVRLHGYVANTSVYMFGPKYVLRDFDEGVEIALGHKGGSERVDLEPYVSFVFDGENYTQIRNIRVSVVGYVRYIGPVVDAPSFHLDVERVELQIDVLKGLVIEFLKTTDVPNGGWDGTVEIKEIYDHKLGGKVMVVKYTTANAGHPGFFLEAIEHHTAVITLNMRGEVVSAFCVWGSFHDGKIWDLLNQRWIQQAMISEQQAIHIGKGFLDGIGYTTGKVLLAKLEEKTPNFYWHDLAELEKPDIQGLRLCWIIRFEQAYRPGHFFEVWIDAYSGEVIGGIQCR